MLTLTFDITSPSYTSVQYARWLFFVLKVDSVSAQSRIESRTYAQRRAFYNLLCCEVYSLIVVPTMSVYDVSIFQIMSLLYGLL